ncbi:MAG TPA: ABC transporter substrate-binding protein [Burkholderiales bacterium]|nr:ABC transporter substrate-binding protein [Burkholderiales bacterium]
MARRIGLLYFIAALLVTAGGASAQTAEPIRIGAILDQSGPVAPLGQYARVGIDMAVAEVNAAGGVRGRPIELVALNSESKPELAASLAVRLAGNADVMAIIGGNFAPASNSIGATVEKLAVPYVTPTALLSETQAKWRYSFFTLADFSEMARSILVYAQKKGYKRLGLIRVEREYGEQGSKFLREFSPKHGVEIVAEERGADGDRDFTAQLTKIRQANPDLIVVWFANPGGSLVIKNARQLGMNQPLVAPISMDGNVTVKLAGPVAEGLVVTSQIAGSEGLPRQQAFISAYAKANPANPEPNSFEAVGYDLVKIVVEALKRTDPPYTRAKVRDAIAALQFEGAGTVVNYKNRNAPTGETLVMIQLVKGRYVLAK